MIKISVFYPYAEGKTFDMDYYCKQHLPLAQRLLGPALKQVAVEQGLAGLAPGAPPPYVAMGHWYFDSLEDFQTAFGPHAETITGDVRNFTDIELIAQISEVKM